MADSGNWWRIVADIGNSALPAWVSGATSRPSPEAPGAAMEGDKDEGGGVPYPLLEPSRRNKVLEHWVELRFKSSQKPSQVVTRDMKMQHSLLKMDSS